MTPRASSPKANYWIASSRTRSIDHIRTFLLYDWKKITIGHSYRDEKNYHLRPDFFSSNRSNYLIDMISHLSGLNIHHQLASTPLNEIWDQEKMITRLSAELKSICFEDDFFCGWEKLPHRRTFMQSQSFLCSGDSGGPVLWGPDHNGQVRIYGVVTSAMFSYSSGFFGCSQQLLGVRLHNKVKDWIISSIDRVQ